MADNEKEHPEFAEIVQRHKDNDLANIFDKFQAIMKGELQVPREWIPTTHLYLKAAHNFEQKQAEPVQQNTYNVNVEQLMMLQNKSPDELMKIMKRDIRTLNPVIQSALPQEVNDVIEHNANTD